MRLDRPDEDWGPNKEGEVGLVAAAEKKKQEEKPKKRKEGVVRAPRVPSLHVEAMERPHHDHEDGDHDGDLVADEGHHIESAVEGGEGRGHLRP